MSNAPIKLQTTDATRAFFLHAVSAHTEVGNSNNHTERVETFVIIIIWPSDKPVYL